MTVVDGGVPQLADGIFDTLRESIPETLTLPVLTGPGYVSPGPAGNPLYAPVTPLGNTDLTTGAVGGTGLFDVLMTTQKAHLQDQYDKGRITGDQFAKAYTEITSATMSTAVQFLLGRDQAYWQAVGAQLQARRLEIEAVTANVQLEIAKAQLAGLGMEYRVNLANFLLAKLRLATESQQAQQVAAQTTLIQSQTEQVDFTVTAMLPAQLDQVEAQTAQVVYQTDNILPAQLAQVQAQTSLTGVQESEVQYKVTTLMPAQVLQFQAQTAQTEYQTSEILPAQKDQILTQTDLVDVQILQGDYTLDFLMPQQLAGLIEDKLTKEKNRTDIMEAQHQLVKEQREVARAQTADDRSSGTPILGMVKKQRDLIDQQIDSFRKDAAQKIGKMFLDAWTVQKTMDEGLAVPTALTNAEISEVMATLRSDNNLGG